MFAGGGVGLAMAANYLVGRSRFEQARAGTRWADDSFCTEHEDNRIALGDFRQQATAP